MKKFNGNDIPKDYPRPQMARQSFVNLNGTWEYAIRDDNDIPVDYDGLINVPFSPESRLSGVGRIIMPNQCIWYHRELRDGGRKSERPFSSSFWCSGPGGMGVY